MMAAVTFCSFRWYREATSTGAPTLAEERIHSVHPRPYTGHFPDTDKGKPATVRWSGGKPSTTTGVEV